MIGFLDCFSGVSGDKFLGALVDAGADPARIVETVRTLPLGEWDLAVEPASRAGFSGTRAVVKAAGEQPSRGWAAIRAMLEGSSLDDRVKEHALEAFRLLAEAEAVVHGIPADEVRFHEVGAVDSIVDIVGAAAGLEALGVERLVCSPVALGGGTVETAHGTLPVPAPATALLLEDVPAYGGPEDGELTTPTGAALVRALVDSFGHMPPMTPRATGYGAGARDTALPNLLRLIVGDPAEGDRGDTVVVLRSAIDHRTPEQLAHALARVMEEGALDAWQSPIVMKKGRAAVEVTVLAAPEDADTVTEALMRETGTLGVRREFTDRIVAERRVVAVETSLGEARFKVARSGATRWLRPEHDDCARIARETGLAIHEVAERLAEEAGKVLGDI